MQLLNGQGPVGQRLNRPLFPRIGASTQPPATPSITAGGRRLEAAQAGNLGGMRSSSRGQQPIEEQPAAGLGGMMSSSRGELPTTTQSCNTAVAPVCATGQDFCCRRSGGTAYETLTGAWRLTMDRNVYCSTAGQFYTWCACSSLSGGIAARFDSLFACVLRAQRGCRMCAQGPYVQVSGQC
jgi:hypothetical protein